MLFHVFLQVQASTSQKPAIHTECHQSFIKLRRGNNALSWVARLVNAFNRHGRIRQSSRRNPLPRMR